MKPADWKSNVELAPPDFGRHEREHGPWKPSTPTIEHVTPEPLTARSTSAEIAAAVNRETNPAVRAELLVAFQIALQRESAKEQEK